ncbi:TPA: family 78 glycoside hydrolase catalytic domain [Vibrio parahaemolyticus]|nr:family 78 glycoside hydrolase catalytic domain [Vibrio parahaemolyticus]HCH4266676.1 family 78 glycoside hydrolase catalytic domain [Vibrio parahaemolyticus]
MMMNRLTVNGKHGVTTVDTLPIQCRWLVDFKQSHFTFKLSSNSEMAHITEEYSNESCYTLFDIELTASCYYDIEVTVFGVNGEVQVLNTSFISGNKGEFSGVWIAANTPLVTDEHYYEDCHNPVFKKQLSITRPTQEALIHIVGLGYYTLFINGQKVSNYELNNDWTNYAELVYYDTFDISGYLRQGDNVIVVELANGWYNPAPLTLFGKYNLRRNLTTGQPTLLADIVLSDQDGKHVVVPTDASWECTTGPYLFNNLYLGEVIDFRELEQANNRLVARAWEPVLVAEGPTGTLKPSYLDKICRSDEVSPKHIHSLSETDHIVDFGTMISGFIDAEFTAQDGDEVTFLYSEQLAGDGTLDTDSTLAGFVGKEVEPNVIVPGGAGAPERGDQRDRCICRAGKMHFVNRYTYHSFRYVQVRGIALEQIHHIKAVYANTFLSPTGHFTCSDENITRLYHAAEITKLNNIHSVIEDCARERLAYGGDMVALAHSQAMMFNSAQLYEKTIKDFVAEQRVNGGFPETAPFMGIQTKGTGEGAGPLGWQLAVPYLLRTHYQYYGNAALVSELLPALERQMAHLNTLDQDNLAQFCLGDWGSKVADKSNIKNGSPALSFTAACFYYYHLTLLVELCQIAGWEEKYSKYNQQALEYKQHLTKKYRNDDGSYADRSQTSYVFALYFDLEGEPSKLISDLKGLVEGSGFDIECGIFGQSFFYQIANRYDLNQLIYPWLNNTIGIPSMLQDGSGSLNEFFGDNYNGSCNHAMFSSYVSWFYSGLGGILVDSDACAADRITIQPFFEPNVDGVDCRFQSVRGEIRCGWQREQSGCITLTVRVPMGLTSARLILPKEWQETMCHLPTKYAGENLVQFDISEIPELQLTLKTGLLTVDESC